ncbi:hypothetical protein SCHPADRAFT_279246 [Schizopora paradoxa]|uniref:Exonuclease domain-containing protein n=1 Tax=Schizopora paradoxa TaxID=27342 RepID=A0A0H2SDL6_9AGAM|nr:hypothetical protein SCHPADRAFT_279246 [Schizopora paradoxa]
MLRGCARAASQFRIISRSSRPFYCRNRSHAPSTAAKLRSLHDRVPLPEFKSESLTTALENDSLVASTGGGSSSVVDRLEMASESTVLKFENGPLVWVDLEMTGLDPKVDKIMEIAVLITDGDLQLVDEGIEFIIHVGKEDLDRSEYCCYQVYILALILRMMRECIVRDPCLNKRVPQPLRCLNKVYLNEIKRRTVGFCWGGCNENLFW